MMDETVWKDDDDRYDSIRSKRDSMNLSSLDYWDYSIELECLKGPEDLQLAAELGKTLLERNKELETALKNHQNVIDEKSQEIGQLKKQIIALREVNEKRIQIYETLDVSIQELEKANKRLASDNLADKKYIKSQCTNIESLESRCEELEQTVDEMTVKVRKLERENQQFKQADKKIRYSENDNDEQYKTSRIQQQQQQGEMRRDESNYEEVTQLMIQIQQLKSQKTRDQKKIQDLTEELTSMFNTISVLEEQVETLRHKEEHVRSLQQEMEEVRMSNVCGKCGGDYLNTNREFLLGLEEEESNVNQNSYRQNNNLYNSKDEAYKSLVEKYEALLEVQAENRRSRRLSKSDSINCLSLQDELKMSGDFNNFNKEEDRQHMKNNKMFSATPTDFSEAETSSSGYSDETSNKGTQTERNALPGSFLCSIADGEDCRFSIYDDACPIESRFRKTPSYRILFREIFAVLKRAAEAKGDDERLPLLEDLTPVSEVPNVPPVTPAQEVPPVDFEDVASLPESSLISETTSETSTTGDNVLDETLKTLDSICDLDKTLTEEEGTKVVQDVRKKSELQRFLEISVDSRPKNKHRRRGNRSPAQRLKPSQAVELLESSGGSGGKRRHQRDSSSRSSSPAVQPHILSTLGRRDVSSYPSMQQPQQHTTTEHLKLTGRSSTWDVKPFLSTAALEVAKLKRLERSYAEVLKFPSRNKDFVPSQRK